MDLSFDNVADRISQFIGGRVEFHSNAGRLVNAGTVENAELAMFFGAFGIRAKIEDRDGEKVEVIVIPDRIHRLTLNRQGRVRFDDTRRPGGNYIIFIPGPNIRAA